MEAIQVKSRQSGKMEEFFDELAVRIICGESISVSITTWLEANEYLTELRERNVYAEAFPFKKPLGGIPYTKEYYENRPVVGFEFKLKKGG